MARGDNKQPSTGKRQNTYDKKANGKNDTGVKSKYEDNPELYNELAEKMAMLGATDQEIAKGLQVAVDTCDRWERDYEDFRVAINRGKDHWATRGIKNTLKSRAMGYNWEERTVETTELECERVDKNGATLRDDKGRKIMVRVPATKTKVVGRHVPGDPACIFFWLTNKQKQEFSHVRVNRVEGEIKGAPLIQNNNYDFTDVGKEELEQLNDILTKAIKQRELSGRPSESATRKQSGTA